MMDYSRNRSLLLKILRTETSEELERVVKEEGLDAEEWLSYGGRENNVGTIEGQMLSPENALVEKITNSMDAILMRKCREEGISPEDIGNAPKTMEEAVERFFGDREHLRKQRPEFAKEWLRVTAEGERGRYPTITIIDKGEGQTPESIESTILSLGENLKARIPFVYGQYNQGGSSALGFTGKHPETSATDVSYLQLVLCRRAPTVIKDIEKVGNYDHFGFTIVRKRFDYTSSKPTYEYLVEKGTNAIFSFPEENTPVKINDSLYGDYEFKEGCVIKLYDYQLKKKSDIINRGLNVFIQRKLPAMPIPIFLRDFRGFGGKPGYAIFGYKETLQTNKNIRDGYPRLHPVDLGAIGKKKIEIFIENHKSMAQHEDPVAARAKAQKSDPHPGRVFFTKDGLVLHTENVAWLRNDCNLPDLANYIYAFIDLGKVDLRTSELFHSAREKFKKGATTESVRDSLKEYFANEDIKALDREYGKLNFNDVKKIDKKALMKLLEREAKSRPEIIDAFELTANDFQTGQKDRGEELPDPNYEGSYLPEKFDLVGDNPREIVEDTYGKVSFDTGATDDLFTRKQDKGEWDWDESNHFQMSRESYKNGRITFRISPKQGVKLPPKANLTFSLKVPKRKMEFKSMITVLVKDKKPYAGEEFPTFFKPPVKMKITIGGTNRLLIKTDAANDYFDREDYPGDVSFGGHDDLAFGKPILKDGILIIKVRCLSEEVKKVADIQVTIKDEKKEFELPPVPVELIPYVIDDQAKIPEPKEITRGEWDGVDPPWTTHTVARISFGSKLERVVINTDSSQFDELNRKKVPEQNMGTARETLIGQIYISSILLFLELKDLEFDGDENADIREKFFDRAIRVAAKTAVQNIKKLIR